MSPAGRLQAVMELLLPYYIADDGTIILRDPLITFEQAIEILNGI